MKGIIIKISKSICTNLAKIGARDWLYGLISLIFPIFFAAKKFNLSFGSFSLPLRYLGDEFYSAAQTYSWMNFFWFKNNHFGWPDGQDYGYAFASQDAMAHVLSAVIGKVKNNPYFGLNIYLLLTFGLVGLITYISLRLIKLNRNYAVMFSITLSLLPQHFNWNTQAITLSSYFLLFPTILILGSQIASRNSPEEFWKTKLSRRSWLIFLVFFGMLYSYYSLGTLLIVLTTVFLLVLVDGNLSALRTVFKSLIAIFVGFLFVAIPSLINAVRIEGEINYLKDRNWTAAFPNSGTFIQSLLPNKDTVSFEIIKLLNNTWADQIIEIRRILISYGLFQEGWNSYVGYPLVLLLIFSTYLVSRNKDLILIKSKPGLILHHKYQTDFSIFLLFALVSFFWQVAGGFGTLFSMFVSSSLRGYARFAIFTFISILIAISLNLRMLQKISNKGKVAYQSLTIVITLVLLSDSLTMNVAPRDPNISIRVAEIENFTKLFPKDCKILQFPVTHFPYESVGWPTYELLAPGLTNTRPDLSWSAGAVGGSKAWKDLSVFTVFQDSKFEYEELRELASKSGFCGIMVNENVWNSMHEFKPWPTYEGTPFLTYDNFLSYLKSGDEYRLSGNKYFYRIFE
jgi:hypothetical protein